MLDLSAVRDRLAAALLPVPVAGAALAGVMEVRFAARRPPGWCHWPNPAAPTS